ncbi:glycosyltransferase [Aeromonas sp. NJAU223]|uniref:glycosyltransferase n=1 Tax=Aeromonas sp. NJAU223 TaxID=3115650 RepID=UPI003DA811B8
MHKVAVLLSAYNGEQWIEEQLSSIIEQNNISLDIYISIDESTDRTLDICQSYTTKNKNITVLPYGFKFGGAGKNFFRLLADTDLNGYDYIAFSDQDDIWHEDKLTKAISELHRYDCYSSNVIAFWEDGREMLIDKSQLQCKWDFLFEAAGPGCTYVFKRDVIIQFKTWLLMHYEKIGDDIELHDWLIYAFARSRGYRWFIDPEPMMRYRQHANNQVGTNNNIKAAKKRFLLIRSKWYRKQVMNIAGYLGLQNSAIFRFGLANGYKGNLYLLVRVNKLRRRTRDRLALALFLLLNIF